MFSHFRLTPRCARTYPRSSVHYYSRCGNSLTHLTRREFSELAPEPPSEDELDAQADAPDPLEQVLGQMEKRGKGETRQPETYNEFMEAAGENFRKADGPNKWLGGRVPFPMNPSFKPPPPVSDAVRTAIYKSYMADPIANDVRALSQKHHLSLKRVDAILRLKGMEADWVQKGIPLQTGFRKGMEMILGARRQAHEIIDVRADANEADMLEQDENRDAARQRYQQLYWESVPEDGREPVVPASLEHAKATAKRYTRMQEAYKSNPQLMPRVKDATTQTPKEKVQISVKPGRSSMKFVDVGGHFIDIDERLKRISESERRAKMTVRRAERKEADDPRKRNRH